jgi:dCMP deaminase
MARRPSKFDMMMQIAHVVKARSTCSRLQVGCILTNLDLTVGRTAPYPDAPPLWDPKTSYTRILAMGYNGMEAGGQNQCDSSQPGQCGCIHAEQNALIKAAPGPKACFVTTSPCLMCARLMINADVRYVYYDKTYRDLSGLKLLELNGVRIGDMGGVSYDL